MKLRKSADGGRAIWHTSDGAEHWTQAGAPVAGANVGGNAFLGKLNADGSALSYFRYYGGSEDTAAALALDRAGNVYVIPERRGGTLRRGAQHWLKPFLHFGDKSRFRPRR